jgi:CheY-like chemotaxis protein
MAQILVLQETPARFKPLTAVLAGRHKLTEVNSVERAMTALAAHNFDLIISRVHLESGSVFEFMHRVKQDPLLKSIPFVCFSGRFGKIARRLDPLMMRIGELHGMKKFIRLEDYCSTGTCDFNALRQTFEECL